MILVLSPHNDDEALFAAFTIIREKAHVIVCYGSIGDYGSSKVRSYESEAAIGILGGTHEQWDVPPGDVAMLRSQLSEALVKYQPTRVYAPDLACSHPDHKILGLTAREIFLGRLTTYHTYDTRGRVVNQKRPVPIALDMLALKHRALACYATQLDHPRAQQFFLDRQDEYYGSDV